MTAVLGNVLEALVKRTMTKIQDPSQHPLQRGFTKSVSPMYAAWIIQELYNEARDAHEPLYVAYLDAKAVFDTVWIKSLMRRLSQGGINGNLWAMINSLHEDATSQIQWAGHLTDTFAVHQGVRQGGLISTVEYKRFIDPLLHLLQDANIGSTIGIIPCCAPTCADDVTLASTSPAELQTLLNLAVSYSQTEIYQLQPAKCMVVPFNHSSDVPWTWQLLEEDLKIQPNTKHIGVHRSTSSNGAADTVKANISKARRTLYSLMSSGMHSKSGMKSCFVPPYLGSVCPASVDIWSGIIQSEAG